MQNDKIIVTLDEAGNFLNSDGVPVGTVGTSTLLKSFTVEGEIVSIVFHQASQHETRTHKYFPIGAEFVVILRGAHVEGRTNNGDDADMSYMDDIYALRLRGRQESGNGQSGNVIELNDDNRNLWWIFYDDLETYATLPDHELKPAAGTTFIEHSALDRTRLQALGNFADAYDFHYEAQVLRDLLDKGSVSSDALADLQYTLRAKLDELAVSPPENLNLRELERNIDHVAIRVAR